MLAIIGRHFPRWAPTISNVNISETNGPIDFISTPTSTKSITTYLLDHVTSIRMDDVIMQFPNGRQKHLQCSYLRNQRSNRRHCNANCIISITAYHLDHVIRIKRCHHHAIQDGRKRTPQENSVRPQRSQSDLKIASVPVGPQETSETSQETS